MSSQSSIFFLNSADFIKCVDFEVFEAKVQIVSQILNQSLIFFLNSLESSCKLLAQSVNNTALMYRSEPSPTESESEGLCKTIESKAVQFLQAYLTVPMNCGHYFLSDVRAFCTSTLQATISFVNDLIKVCMFKKIL